MFVLLLNFNSKKVQKEDFQLSLEWFEREFDELFQNTTQKLTKNDKQLANSLLNRLSELINKYDDDKLLYDLVSTLNNIEKKHPILF
jgi:uncharacterized damage-inducible protein DinB